MQDYYFDVTMSFIKAELRISSLILPVTTTIHPHLAGVL